uniref:DUF4351 domain-containing protein n=1 Tax=Candidatus Kentrum sp. DK TaxID=2126562 RepID=A0A450TG19_9GAMM|nr:MAG: hypothetical protein BECKDK2373B_GA0170837_11607 [Candidatus Kentron sp. DK]
MLTQVDIERIPAYQLGMERGKERGEAVLLTRQLGYKFGSVPRDAEKHIENAVPGELALWGQRVLNARTLDEVFAPLSEDSENTGR